jgi:hypothetical protein
VVRGRTGGVEIISQCPFKQLWILWNDGDDAAQITQTDDACVDTVDQNFAGSWFNYAEQREGE